MSKIVWVGEYEINVCAVQNSIRSTKGTIWLILMLKARTAAVFSWWGQLTKLKGPNIHPAGPVDHPWKPVENIKHAISSWMWLVGIKVLTYPIIIFQFQRQILILYLSRYCGTRFGLLAQHGVYLAPSTWSTGPINWKPQLFWPLKQIVVLKMI